MHDCRATESRLVDLVFDELGADERRRLLAELDACAHCLDEYSSMTGTLSAFDETAGAAPPDESYWPIYHAALRRRLSPAAQAVAAPRRAPLWKRVFVARLTVPAPVAAVVALALLVSAVMALRPRTTSVIPSPAPDAQAQTESETPPALPVPVVSERVITRVVYVEKWRREKRAGRPAAPAPAPHEEKESGQGGLFTRANLTDFQPANELKIRVIKRSNSDED